MKKFLRMVLCAALIAALALSMAGCGEINKAQTALNKMFSALKTMDLDEARKYVNVDAIMDSGSEANENAMAIMGTLFGNLEWEIVSAQIIDANNVSIKTKITTTDMKPVLGEFLTKSLEYVFSDALSDSQSVEEEMDEKFEEIFVECASKPDLASVTNEVDIKAVKAKGGKWKIETDDVLVNALLGGLTEAAEGIQNSFSMDNED